MQTEILAVDLESRASPLSSTFQKEAHQLKSKQRDVICTNTHRFLFIQSNLDYLDLKYPDFLIIRTCFSRPIFHESLIHIFSALLLMMNIIFTNFDIQLIFLWYFLSCTCISSLLSNSENREHLKYFRNVDCLVPNQNKVQDTQANLKTTN